MNTKEAIDFLSRRRSGLPIDLETKWDEVIELLQRGEKYEQMVRDLPITPEKLTILSDSIIKGIENAVKNVKEGD